MMALGHRPAAIISSIVVELFCLICTLDKLAQSCFLLSPTARYMCHIFFLYNKMLQQQKYSDVNYQVGSNKICFSCLDYPTKDTSNMFYWSLSKKGKHVKYGLYQKKGKHDKSCMCINRMKVKDSKSDENNKKHCVFQCKKNTIKESSNLNGNYESWFNVFSTLGKVNFKCFG